MHKRLQLIVAAFLLLWLCWSGTAVWAKSGMPFWNYHGKAKSAAAQPADDKVATGSTGSPAAPARPVEKPTLFTSRSSIDVLFSQWEAKENWAVNRVSTLFGVGLTALPADLPKAYHNLVGGGGPLRLLAMLLGFLLLVGAGILVEWGISRTTAGLRRQIMYTQKYGLLIRIRNFLLFALLDLLSAAAYLLTTFVLFVLFYSPREPAYVLVSNYLIVTYYVRITLFFAGLVLRPGTPPLRLVPLGDEGAVYLYRWSALTMGVAFLLARTCVILWRMGIGQELFVVLFSIGGAFVAALLVGLVWCNRKRVGRAIREGYWGSLDEREALREKIGEYWHIFAAFYVIVIALFWEANLLLGSQALGGKVLISFLGVPGFVLLDRGVQRLLNFAAVQAQRSNAGRQSAFVDRDQSQGRDVVAANPAENDKAHVRNYLPLINRVARILLAAVFVFGVFRLWGIDIPFARYFTRTGLAILLTLVLAYLAWEFAKVAIDRKIGDKLPGTDEDLEGGGVGGTRSETLLLLLRKFVLAVLVVMVTMIVMSAIGINIGPLIAGAGVIGLAIGFGAQTLVKDIISGIFFLIDDAFRVGDYVDTGKLKGTVEHISLRSLQLRHHRGMVHTIPFSSLSSVTNFSRDFIVSKLDFRVRYDADINKIKKIIKKIDKKVAANEELRHYLLDNIKSQGVKQLDDSAMIMRVKFKTIPGGQFLVQREVFKQLHEAFREQGIEFAHRNVTVYLPPEANAGGSDGQGDEPSATAPAASRKALDAAGAAAAAAIAESEAAAAAAAEKEPGGAKSS